MLNARESINGKQVVVFRKMAPLCITMLTKIEAINVRVKTLLKCAKNWAWCGSRDLLILGLLPLFAVTGDRLVT